MYKTVFKWLDNMLNKDSKRWKIFLECLPGLLFIFQTMLFLLYTQTGKKIFHITILLFSAALAMCAFCFWKVKPIAKKKYQLRLMWGRYDSIIAPLMVIGAFIGLCLSFYKEVNS